jgi:hypothetical protein
MIPRFGNPHDFLPDFHFVPDFLLTLQHGHDTKQLWFLTVWPVG